MVAPKTQTDIVNQRLLELQQGDSVTTDKIRVPGIKELFEVMPDKSEVLTDKVKVPGLVNLYTQTRAEIASTLVSVLSYRPSVCGIKWKTDNSVVEISYYKEGTTKMLCEEALLLDIMTNVLKARANITSLEWNLQDPFISVTYSI